MELEVDVLFGRILFGLIGVVCFILLVIFLVEKIRSFKNKAASYSFDTNFDEKKNEEETHTGVISKHFEKDYI